MSETSKQEVLLSDLGIIQSQVEILANKCKDLTEVNIELETKLSSIKKENSDLEQKISKLESELQNIKKKPGNDFFNSLNEKEKEELKNNIGELISRIDFHLSS
jgi:chromosome segregation ATPase